MISLSVDLSEITRTNNIFHWYENDLSLKIMEKKYLHSDEKTYEEFLNRIIKIFDKDLQKNLYKLMKAGSFFPGGRSLYGIGSKGKFNATVSNCYIVDIGGDSLEQIYHQGGL